MKLDRIVVRLSALAAVAILLIPFVVDQVSAFGNASDSESFAPRAERTDDTEVPDIPILTDIEVTAADTTAPRVGSTPPSDVAEPVLTYAAIEPSDARTYSFFRGTVARNKTSFPNWKAAAFTAPTSITVDFAMKWKGKGQLKFNVRDLETDTIIAADISKDRAKEMTVELEAGRSYRLAVWTKQGWGRFTVSVAVPETVVADATTQTEATTTTTTTTTTTAPPTTTTTTPPTTTTTAPPALPPRGGSYPGEPANGKLYWGSSIQGNGDPVARHENEAGHPLTIRRTFYQWSNRTGGMVNTARNDIANGRLPWVSVKTPSWTSMANGDHDDGIDEMLRALDALNGPVWLTVHHEPEGGGGNNSPDDPGGPSAHVAMNRRVRERMTALGTDNIALAPILMGWTFNSSSGRNPNDWYEPGIYDFIGVDHYMEGEKSLLTDNWFRIRAWAADRGMDIAIGEWGMRGTDAAAGERVREWYDHAAGSHNDGRGARVVGLSAFDSGLNSPNGSWELKGAQLDVFRALLKDSRTANPS